MLLNKEESFFNLEILSFPTTELNKCPLEKVQEVVTHKRQMDLAFTFKLFGAPAGIRTPNLLIRSWPVNLSF
jgi:hypothetical protein